MTDTQQIKDIIRNCGVHGTLVMVIDEMERVTGLLPRDTVTRSGETIFDGILPLLDKAQSMAADWDAEVRRNGLSAGSARE